MGRAPARSFRSRTLVTGLRMSQVYSDPRNVDDDLVTSIVQPAESSANAPEVCTHPAF